MGYRDNARPKRLDLVEFFGRAFPSHGRGRRFNPYSAHQPSPLRGYGWQASLCPLHAKRRRLPVVARQAKTGCGSMKYVYLLQSIEHADETYVGLTDDLRSRFAAHNAGRSPHTAKYRPWRLVTYIASSSTRKAADFERYLKTASGRPSEQAPPAEKTRTRNKPPNAGAGPRSLAIPQFALFRSILGGFGIEREAPTKTPLARKERVPP